MSDTYYQVVCDRHTPPVVLADVCHDPECEASQRYEHQMRRWDRHNSGEEPILDRYGRPHPRRFRPYMYRHSSRQITVYPREHMFVPELVDRGAPDLKTLMDVFAMLNDGQPPPHYHDGYVRVLDYGIGDTENTDGHTLRIGCELCKETAEASADTLAMVLDRIAASLDTVSLPLRDWHGNDTGETAEVRVLPLAKLCSELGDNPRG